MKVLFVLSHTGIFRHYDGVVRALCSRGHTVIIHRGRGYKENVSDQAIAACQAETPGCEVDWDIPVHSLSLPWLLLRHTLRAGRELINYGIYFHPEHPSPRLASRWERKLYLPFNLLIKVPILRKLLLSRPVTRLIRKYDRLIPPEPPIMRWLEDHRPDVVVVSPYIYGSARDVDYVKAARKLGIPTIVSIASWDNLTTKGTFQFAPSLTLVWNQAMFKEAVDLHGLSPHKVFYTGAPTFDYWFAMKPTPAREAFCEAVGLDPATPYILYLGSSTSIAGDETAYLQAFVDGLARRPETRDLNVLLRPHPLNAKIWQDFAVPERVVIWPPGGAIPDTPETRQDYYNSQFYAAAVVGINTSAMVESAIVDKPCVTIMDDHYRQAQTGMGHFHHLLRADYMEIASDFDEAADLLAAILKGADRKAGNRRQFVQDFIRPWGMEQPVSHIVADVIEAVGAGQPTRAVAERYLAAASQPERWQEPASAVPQPNTFFDRRELQALWGHTQRMAHWDDHLLARLAQPNILGIRAWEYGRLLALLAGFPERKTWQVLDVGTGNSTFPAYLLEQGGVGRVMTLDYWSPLEPQSAGHRQQDAALQIPRVAGDMLHMPLAADSFDLVTCISAIEHLDEDPVTHGQLDYLTFLAKTRMALAHLMRVVRRGGYLYLTTEAYIPGLQLTDNWRRSTVNGNIWSAYRIEDVSNVFVDVLQSGGFELVGGFQYEPELVVANNDRSTFRGRYFTTFSVFARKL